MYEEQSFEKKLIKFLIFSHLYLFFITKVVNHDGHLDFYWDFWLLFLKTVIPIGLGILLVSLLIYWLWERREEEKQELRLEMERREEEERRRIEKRKERALERERIEKEAQWKKELEEAGKRKIKERKEKPSKDVLKDAIKDFF